MKNRYREFYVFVFAILVLFLAFSFIYFRRQQTSILADRAEILVEPVNINTATNSEFILNFELDSGNAHVGAADLAVNFDPELLTVKKVTQGNFFVYYPVNKIENGSVRLSGVASFKSGQLILPNGRENLAAITFKTLDKPGNTVISVDRKRTVVGSKGMNILDAGRLSDITVEIN